jgi:hypothetical protein
MQRKNAVDWSKYLLEGEQMGDVSMEALRLRRNRSLGGDKTTRQDKVRLNGSEQEFVAGQWESGFPQ